MFFFFRVFGMYYGWFMVPFLVISGGPRQDGAWRESPVAELFQKAAAAQRQRRERTLSGSAFKVVVGLLVCWVYGGLLFGVCFCSFIVAYWFTFGFGFGVSRLVDWFVDVCFGLAFGPSVAPCRGKAYRHFLSSGISPEANGRTR